MDRDELAAWLQLLDSPGVGRAAARRLLAAFGSPEAVFDAPPAARREVVAPDISKALDSPPESLPDLVDTTLRWLAEGSANVPRRLLALGDPAYPDALLQTADPPLLLYLQGDATLLRNPCLGIVGSRTPTPQGRDNARHFSARLAEAGWTIVSGLALGVDGAAHEGCLSRSGKTVAVVGTGLDQIYPRRHQELGQRIAREGLLVSEFRIGAPPLAPHFPQRNRIIAGLSRGTLVIEAALQSGSLITARMASEAGREVFAIPGSIHSPQSRGCHSLIKQGAKLVETAEDVLEELPLAGSLAGPSGLDRAADTPSAEVDPLLEALGFEPVSLDALVARTGWPAPQLNAHLLELELQGDVARLPGQLFQRVSTG